MTPLLELNALLEEWIRPRCVVGMPLVKVKVLSLKLYWDSEKKFVGTNRKNQITKNIRIPNRSKFSMKYLKKLEV